MISGRETFITRGTFDAAFPCHSLFLVVPIFTRTYLCLFSKTTRTSVTAACSVFIRQEGRPQGRMPLRESHFEMPLPECSRSSHLQHPGSLSGAIPHPSCCLSLLTALAAESPDLCTVLPLTFPLGIDLRITSLFCLFILSEHVQMH